MIRRAVDMATEAGVDLISFWPTRVPVYGISWRYYTNRFFRTLGTPSWKGREVWLPRATAPAAKAQALAH